jgi:type IV pilus assembly protein PilB
MLDLAGDEVDVRMSTMPSMHGETLVMRLLRRRHEGVGIDSLGLSDDVGRVYLRALGQPQGIVLVTGPTGSGKTTTLYAGLSQVADVERNVITLEDPVEYELGGINQTQINAKIGLTFATGMRTVLRQDPDVVMVGEIRDTETAKLAIEASMTGHLVLSTLHTNDAISTVSRMAELGADRRLLASSLLLIMSQRLVRVVCHHCGDEVKPDPDALARLDLGDGALDGIPLRAGAGCPACSSTGYLGRTMACEAFRVSPEISELITQGIGDREVRLAARSQGMRSLREDALRLALAGTTTLDEVLRVTPEDPDFETENLLERVLGGPTV